jgi:hypothetical protein
MLLKRIRHLLILLLILSSCEIIFDIDESVSNELKPFFEDFKREAERRNIALDYKDYTIELVYDLQNATFQSKPSKKATGHIEYFNKHKSKFKIYISREFFEEYYLNGNEAQRLLFEKTCFHEFGHGFLNREHSDDYFSIMKQGFVFYTQLNRNEMLDELFLNQNN